MPQKRLLLLLILPLFLLLAAKPGAPTRPPQQGLPVVTTVYVVRHAEKDLTPSLTDPPLTPAGVQRALALRKELRRRRVAAIFITNTWRTRATAAPLADALKLTPQLYDAKNLPALTAKIRADYAGKTVLVVGHSNTMLETVESLGALRPVPTVNDAQFDYLLEVKLPEGGGGTATVKRYGTPSVVPLTK